MDQRDSLSLPGSGSYYLQQGTSDSVMGIQGMNSLSNPGMPFHSNIGRNLIGSTLPLDTSSSSMSPHGISVGPPPPLGVGPPPTMMQGEPVRRKRGRPRKYGRDGAVSLALSASTSNPLPFVSPTQKRRGRPPGTGRKHQLTPLGGSNFTGPGKLVPHIINVAVGEDIKRKVLSFAQGRQSTVVLSGNGSVSAVNIRISSSAGSVTYEGRFDILSLTGSYTRNEANAAQSPIGCLNVTLSDPDGRVIGGGVEAAMLAATAVQVVVGSLVPRTSKARLNPGGDSEDGRVGNLVIPASG